jgi:hypothetical protein
LINAEGSGFGRRVGGNMRRLGSGKRLGLVFGFLVVAPMLFMTPAGSLSDLAFSGFEERYERP